MQDLKTILLVEDNPNDVELALEALADYRLANDIVVANDGEQALDYLYRRGGRFAARDPAPPAVVLLDLKMPKVDGLTVLRSVKADPGLKCIPIVMLTSSREERDLVESYQLGVNAYVVKPVDFGQFVEAIKKLGYFWAVLNEPPPLSGQYPDPAVWRIDNDYRGLASEKSGKRPTREVSGRGLWKEPNVCKGRSRVKTPIQLPAVGIKIFSAQHSTPERNRRKFRRHWPSALAVIPLGLVIFVSDAFPQTEESLPSPSALKKMSVEDLMDIEVTSVSKRPERLSETASAIQVITQEDIRRSGATSLPEALRLASNLEVAQIDSHQWAISARGFNSTTSNKLLVLIDGRTVYTPLFAGVFWDVQDTLLEDIDRIEVISGPWTLGIGRRVSLRQPHRQSAGSGLWGVGCAPRLAAESRAGVFHRRSKSPARSSRRVCDVDGRSEIERGVFGKVLWRF